MSKGIGRLQRQILEMMTQKALAGWSTSTRDILNHLFTLPDNPRPLRYGQFYQYGYRLGPVDDAGIIKDLHDIKHQEYDFTETQKALVRRAIRALAQRGLITEVPSPRRHVHLKEWIPNPPPPQYEETKARREARFEESMRKIRQVLRQKPR